MVLTGEEYEELLKGVKTYDYTVVFKEQDAYRWEQGYLQGRKEIVDKLKARFSKSREYYEVDTGTAWSNGCIGGIINDTIDEIAKEIEKGPCNE